MALVYLYLVLVYPPIAKRPEGTGGGGGADAHPCTAWRWSLDAA